MSLNNLEEALLEYQQEPSRVPFNIADVKIEAPKPVVQQTTKRQDTASVYAAMLAQIPAFASFGSPYKSTAPEMLTEPETGTYTRLSEEEKGD